MEIKLPIKKWRLSYLVFALLVIAQANIYAQPTVSAGRCDFKDGEFYIEVNKNINAIALKNFIIKYDLGDLDLKNVIEKNRVDTLKKLGWKIQSNTKEKLIITRPLFGASDLSNPVNGIINTEKHPTIAELFPAVSDDIVYGYNKFKNKSPFFTTNSSVRFFMKKNLAAKKVMLAGSFNNWSPDNLPMTKTDSGWIADVKLGPGKYWYKFVSDGEWMYDSDNLLRENDGIGNINSVFYRESKTFKLDGNSGANKVYVAGSFNHWRPHELQMSKTSDGWILPVYLAEGTHTYKFVVDNNWIADVKNTERLPDSHGGYNSVIRIGKPYVFKLKGYTNAKQVTLSGSFNDWRPDELLMKKTGGGWELPYTLGPGNHEYKFIVDEKWIPDPANPLTVTSADNIINSYLIIGANYTFRLKGKSNAKKVYLAGDFNNWSPNSLPMKHEGDEWTYSVHLSIGKHKYKFIVDGNWILDPGNKQWEQNEYGNGNSVIWIEK